MIENMAILGVRATMLRELAVYRGYLHRFIFPNKFTNFTTDLVKRNNLEKSQFLSVTKKKSGKKFNFFAIFVVPVL